MASTKTSKKTPVWKKPNPKPRVAKTRLTPESKAAAKAAAERGGRRYPNLVDNMRAARAQKRKG